MNTPTARLRRLFPLSWRDTLVTGGVFAGAMLLCALLLPLYGDGGYISMVFVLAVVLVSYWTNGYFYGMLMSVSSVLCVNYLFTYPYYHLNFTISGYPIAFVTMLVVSLVISTITTQAREKEKLRVAAEAERVRANLLRSISHDLRTPLTIILGTCSTLLENDATLSPQKRREMLASMQTDTDWLIRMVENLLSITRMNGEGTVLNKQPEVVEEVVADVVRKFRSHFREPPVRVQVPEEPLEAPMDPILIAQVLSNLLNNVVHHAQSATHIDLRVWKEGECAVFEVRDDGPGFSPAVLNALSGGGPIDIPGTRADRSRNMGIGLSVCLSIIRAHGGQLRAQTAPEGGASVRFTLPLQEVPYEQSPQHSHR